MTPVIKWSNNHILLLDQRKLPSKIQYLACKNHKDVINAIKKMAIRGAPAIGIAAAMGLAMGSCSIRAKNFDSFRRRFREMADEMAQARPTAVNLGWAVQRMTSLVDSCSSIPLDKIRQILRRESESILAEDIEINKRIGGYGEALVPGNAVILTHCNAGALATGGYGTALGIVRAAHEAGKKIKVLADETRPWLQGLRLTCFELMEDGIPVDVIADNAAGSFMRRKMVDLVITGADRIAANGDVANKIGTYQVAVLARENRVPFYVAAPLSTIDLSIKNGDSIPIEERDPDEITHFNGRMIGPAGVKAINPSFDITPAKYITAIITEKGIVNPPYVAGLKSLFTAETQSAQR